MSKIKLYRQSGRPPNVEKASAFEEDTKKLYDLCENKVNKLYEKASSNAKNRLFKVPKMIMMQRFLRYGDRQLAKKYGTEELVEMPKSAKAWADLIASYEDVPIMVARELNSGKPILIIMDSLQ